eukprot:GEMP01063367.1.p1 GENE.GEMP01063367.1~~GEMP01063367.1.p1  ORF type:complete len:148 (+),score=17.10 GEMP01063367.1:532-975(+)
MASVLYPHIPLNCRAENEAYMVFASVKIAAMHLSISRLCANTDPNTIPLPAIMIGDTRRANYSDDATDPILFLCFHCGNKKPTSWKDTKDALWISRGSARPTSADEEKIIAWSQDTGRPPTTRTKMNNLNQIYISYIRNMLPPPVVS